MKSHYAIFLTSSLSLCWCFHSIYAAWKNLDTPVVSEVLISNMQNYQIIQTDNRTDARHVPLVLISRGCFGTTFLLNFAKNLVLRHTGLDPFVSFGDKMVDEYLDLRKKTKINNRYNVTLEEEMGRFSASKQMVFTTHDMILRNKSQIMVPKILVENLNRGVIKGLKQLGAKFVVTYRRNLLRRTVCNVRDCFELKETKHKHTAMFENGTRCTLCFDRRRNSHLNVLANIDRQMFSETMQALVQQHGCKEGLRDPVLKQTLDKVMMNVSGYAERYPRFALESLEAFQYEGLEGFNQSFSDWKTLLRRWGIEPQDKLIMEEMRRVGIGKRQHKSVLDNVYNRHEIESLFDDWAKNESLCDWRWMTKADQVSTA